MGLGKFQIAFDSSNTNSHGVFYAGQTISGRVFVTLDAEKKVRGISLTLKGKAEVQWTETQNSGKDRRTVRYYNIEKYFDHTIPLYGEGAEQVMQPGEYSFQFSYQLPANIPTSFENDHGHVRYTAKAVIDRPWKFDHETKAGFTVIYVLDLNTDPSLAEPKQVSKQKKFCCWCCVSPPLNATLVLPAGGVVPGETLRPSVDVENSSDVYIWQVLLTFVKVVTLYARGKSRVSEHVICEKQLGQVGAHDSQTWTTDTLSLPALPPSNLSKCSIIDVDYFLRVILKPSGCCHHNVTLSLPVVMGTIPFIRDFSAFTPSSSMGQPPLGWNWNVAPSAPSLDAPPCYPDIPPPTFEECVHGAKSLQEQGESEHMHGDKSYAPRYPFYTHNMP